MMMRGITTALMLTTLMADPTDGRLSGGSAPRSSDTPFQQRTREQAMPGATVSDDGYVPAGRHLVQQPLGNAPVASSDAPVPTQLSPPGFVQRNGTGLVLDGQPYHVVGANQCACARRGVGHDSRRTRVQKPTPPSLTRMCLLLPDYLMLTALTDWDNVVAVLDEAKALGLNTLRTWAFAERVDGDPPNKPALTLQPGVYDETTFRGASAMPIPHHHRFALPCAGNHPSIPLQRWTG